MRNLRPLLFFSVLIIFALPVFVFAMLPSEPGILDGGTLLMFLMLLVFAAGAYFVPNQWDRKYGRNEKGARGEVAVGRELEKLHAEGFHVFHDYKPERSANVDHFIIGEDGVFIVETKSWSGVISSDGTDILINGRRCDRSPVRQAVSEARSIRELLNSSCGVNIWVQPLLCFYEGDLHVFEKIACVEVTDMGALNRSIMRLANENPDYRRLSPAQVKAISRRLTKHLGESPASSPGCPPETPGRSKRLLTDTRIWVATYVSFIFVLTLVFADRSVAMLEGLAQFYRFVVLLQAYYL